MLFAQLLRPLTVCHHGMVERSRSLLICVTRNQQVNCCFEREPVVAGVPQGTKLGPINNIQQLSDMWKFVNDLTLLEAIKKEDTSYIQNAVDQFTIHTKAQINEENCGEVQRN